MKYAAELQNLIKMCALLILETDFDFSECSGGRKPFVETEELQQARLLQPLSQHAGRHGPQGAQLYT